MNRVENEVFDVSSRIEEEVLPKDNCTEEHHKRHLQPQVDATLKAPVHSCPSPENVTTSKALAAPTSDINAQTNVTSKRDLKYQNYKQHNSHPR